MGKFKLFITSLCLVLALPLHAQDPIKVGLVVPLSGPWARQGGVMRAHSKS